MLLTDNILLLHCLLAKIQLLKKLVLYRLKKIKISSKIVILFVDIIALLLGFIKENLKGL